VSDGEVVFQHRETQLPTELQPLLIFLWSLYMANGLLTGSFPV